MEPGSLERAIEEMNNRGMVVVVKHDDWARYACAPLGKDFSEQVIKAVCVECGRQLASAYRLDQEDKQKETGDGRGREEGSTNVGK